MRNNGKWQIFFLKAVKPIVFIMLLLCAVNMIEPIQTFIYKYQHWDEIVEERGDTLLTQHLFVSDRLFIQDPSSYEDHVALDNADYYHNVRVGSDLTLEQTKIVFKNGDIFRQVSTPYSEKVKTTNIDTLKLIHQYKYPAGTCYYYDKETESWVEQGKFHGGSSMPGETLCYINFDDKYYVLTDSIYAYEDVEDGIVNYVENSGDSFFNNDGTIWQLIMSYRNIEGRRNEHWLLESSSPLVDLESSNLLGSAKILSDGLYEKVEEGYTPYGENYYARTSIGSDIAALIEGPSRADAELAFAQLYLACQGQAEDGSFVNPLQNKELYEKYEIKYNYVDIEENAQFGLDMIAVAASEDTTAFDEPMAKLAGFFKRFIAENSRTVDGKIEVPAYYRAGSNCTEVESSEAAQAKLAEFLKAYGEKFSDNEAIELAKGL